MILAREQLTRQIAFEKEKLRTKTPEIKPKVPGFGGERLGDVRRARPPVIPKFKVPKKVKVPKKEVKILKKEVKVPKIPSPPKVTDPFVNVPELKIPKVDNPYMETEGTYALTSVEIADIKEQLGAQSLSEEEKTKMLLNWNNQKRKQLRLGLKSEAEMKRVSSYFLKLVENRKQLFRDYLVTLSDNKDKYKLKHLAVNKKSDELKEKQESYE